MLVKITQQRLLCSECINGYSETEKISVSISISSIIKVIITPKYKQPIRYTQWYDFFIYISIFDPFTTALLKI